jgi:hypothetical protein
MLNTDNFMTNDYDIIALGASIICLTPEQDSLWQTVKKCCCNGNVIDPGWPLPP